MPVVLVRPGGAAIVSYIRTAARVGNAGENGFRSWRCVRVTSRASGTTHRPMAELCTISIVAAAPSKSHMTFSPPTLRDAWRCSPCTLSTAPPLAPASRGCMPPSTAGVANSRSSESAGEAERNVGFAPVLSRRRSVLTSATSTKPAWPAGISQLTCPSCARSPRKLALLNAFPNVQYAFPNDFRPAPKTRRSVVRRASTRERPSTDHSSGFAATKYTPRRSVMRNAVSSAKTPPGTA